MPFGLGLEDGEVPTFLGLSLSTVEIQKGEWEHEETGCWLQGTVGRLGGDISWIWGSGGTLGLGRVTWKCSNGCLIWVNLKHIKSYTDKFHMPRPPPHIHNTQFRWCILGLLFPLFPYAFNCFFSFAHLFSILPSPTKIILLDSKQTIQRCLMTTKT